MARVKAAVEAWCAKLCIIRVKRPPKPADSGTDCARAEATLSGKWPGSENLKPGTGAGLDAMFGFMLGSTFPRPVF